MPPRHPPALSPRERQVMDALYRLRRATVSELVEAVPDDLTYSAVRAVLRTLRSKGHVAYREQGPRYVYRPSVPRVTARLRAVRHLVRTFFDGCPEAAALALLEMSDLELTEAQLRRLDERVARARSMERMGPRARRRHPPEEGGGRRTTTTRRRPETT